MHEWMTDNDQTPLVVVDATVEGVMVPTEHVQEGRIVLNIAWSATRNLLMENDEISFQARFGGVAHAVTLPMSAVKGIYARESGQGMVFQDEPVDSPAESDDVAGAPAASNSDSDDPGPDDPPRPGRGGPNLRIVK